MGLIVVAAVAATLPTDNGYAQVVRRPSLIEFRIAQEAAAPELEYVVSPFLEEGIYVDQEAVLQPDGISHASASIRSKRLILHIELTEEAALQLAATTEANVGRQMAFFFGSQLLSSTVIVEPLRSDVLNVSNVLDVALDTDVLPASLTDTIVSTIAARWPPRW